MAAKLALIVNLGLAQHDLSVYQMQACTAPPCLHFRYDARVLSLCHALEHYESTGPLPSGRGVPRALSVASAAASAGRAAGGARCRCSCRSRAPEGQGYITIRYMRDPPLNPPPISPCNYKMRNKKCHEQQRVFLRQAKWGVAAIA
jgi:hypothetical protein